MSLICSFLLIVFEGVDGPVQVLNGYNVQRNGLGVWGAERTHRRRWWCPGGKQEEKWFEPVLEGIRQWMDWEVVERRRVTGD